MNMAGRIITTLGTILVCISLGCNGNHADTPVRWQCSFDEVEGVAVIDSETLRLVFSGVMFESSPLKQGGGASFSMCVAGTETEDMSVVAHKTKMTTSYGNGECTITVNGNTVKVIDSGKRVQAGDATFPLNDKKLTLKTAADGSATREPQH